MQRHLHLCTTAAALARRCTQSRCRQLTNGYHCAVLLSLSLARAAHHHLELQGTGGNHIQSCACIRPLRRVVGCRHVQQDGGTSLP